MNKTEVIAKVSEKSGIPADTCEIVINAFEKQFGDSLLKKFMGKKNNHAEMAEGISQNTNISSQDCEKVLTAFEEVFGDGLTDKLKFWK
jgi:nucleoid DNA-binding protein